MATNADPLAALQAKSAATAAPAPDAQQPAPQTKAPAQPDASQPQDSGSDESSLPDESGAPVKLQKSFSALNESLIKLADESGVQRSLTMPYSPGEMHTHVSAVGQAAGRVGGLTNNILFTAHHSGGAGWGSDEGHTVGFPADKLRNTVIPKDDENAKAALSAARRFLNQTANLLGDDDPSVKLAQNQLKMVGKATGAGMHLLDFGVALVQLVHGPIQAIARAHSGTKEGGHSPQLRAPGAAAPQPDDEDTDATPASAAPAQS